MDIVPHNTETGGHSATPWLQFEQHEHDLVWLTSSSTEWSVISQAELDEALGPIDLQPQETPAGLLLLSADALATLRALAVDGDQ